MTILKYVSLLKRELAPELLIKLKLLKESNLSVYISGALQVRVCLSRVFHTAAMILQFALRLRFLMMGDLSFRY